MRVYESDQEQVDAIKRWWKENGKFTIVIIILAVAASFGWRYWQQHRLAQAERASIVYEQMLGGLMAQKSDQFNYFSNLLINNYARTPYAKLAALMQAQQAVNANQLEKADSKLTWVINNANSKSIRQIAKSREARVLLSQKRYDQALKILEKIDDPAYVGPVNEVRGNIYAAMNQKENAKKAYKIALTNIPKDEPMHSFVQMKFSDVQ